MGVFGSVGKTAGSLFAIGIGFAGLAKGIPKPKKRKKKMKKKKKVK